jgi:hypothetical protein
MVKYRLLEPHKEAKVDEKVTAVSRTLAPLVNAPLDIVAAETAKI